MKDFVGFSFFFLSKFMVFYEFHLDIVIIFFDA